MPQDTDISNALKSLQECSYDQRDELLRQMVDIVLPTDSSIARAFIVQMSPSVDRGWEWFKLSKATGDLQDISTGMRTTPPCPNKQDERDFELAFQCLEACIRENFSEARRQVANIRAPALLVEVLKEIAKRSKVPADREHLHVTSKNILRRLYAKDTGKWGEDEDEPEEVTQAISLAMNIENILSGSRTLKAEFKAKMRNDLLIRCAQELEGDFSQWFIVNEIGLIAAGGDPDLAFEILRECEIDLYPEQVAEMEIQFTKGYLAIGDLPMARAHLERTHDPAERALLYTRFFVATRAH